MPDNVSPLFRSPGPRDALATGGEPPHDGGMEARVARLETDIDYIKRDVAEIKSDVREIKRDQRADFRLLFGAIIATTLGLSALMAKGFGWL